MVETEVNYCLLYRVVRTVAHRGHATFFFFFFFFFFYRAIKSKYRAITDKLLRDK